MIKTRKNKALQIFLGLLLACSPLLSWAEQPKTTALPTITCPPIQSLQLHTDTMIWGTYGGWKSYERSFAHTITGFLGAQWQGTNLGNIVCLYSGGPDKMTFPVEIHLNRLVYIPTSGAWKDHAPSVKNCVSHDIKACPFQPVPVQHQDNIYEQVHDIKDQDPSNSIAPF